MENSVQECMALLLAGHFMHAEHSPQPWDAQIKNGNPGNGRGSYQFHRSESLGGPFLLFERGQEKKYVCVCVFH